jgi:hypothetical protein
MMMATTTRLVMPAIGQLAPLRMVRRTLELSCERQGASGARCPSEARADARQLQLLVRWHRGSLRHSGASSALPSASGNHRTPNGNAGVARRPESIAGDASTNMLRHRARASLKSEAPRAEFVNGPQLSVAQRTRRRSRATRAT